MSEQDATFKPSDEEALSHSSGISPGAGELLKHAREAAGLHIAALAVLLKVPVKKLEALEASRFDLLPDAVFVRALASSVCRTLKIDAAPVLALLPQTDAPKLTYQGVGINAPFRAPGDGPSPSVWSQLSRPAVLAGVLLLLGALVLIFLPAIKNSVHEVKTEVMDSKLAGMATGESDKSGSPVVTTAKQTIAEASDVSAKAGLSPVESSSMFPSATPTLQALQAAVLPLAAASSISSSTASTSVSLVKPTVTATPSVPAPISPSKALSAGTSSPTFVVTAKAPLATDVVVFTAKSESWVEVIDSKGQVVLRRVLATGEVVGAAGVLPLKVVIGRVNATQVAVRGQFFDLNAVAKDNVARFEVK
jgi:cytoskeleton protein RodZ